MPPIVFARQSKSETGLSKEYDGQRLKNYFLRPTDGYSPAALIGRSGYNLFCGCGQVRAQVNHNGILFAVAAGSFIKVNSDGSFTVIGSVKDSIQTTMDSSGQQIAIVAGDSYYYYDGSTFTIQSTGSVLTPRSITFQDGYFIVIGETLTRKDALTISGLYDGSTFNGLDLAFAENNSDALVGAVSDHGELWLFGTETTEIFYNSGNADFPFERNSGAVIERGCIDGQTIQKEDNAVFWVGSDGVVYRSTGSSPEVISTREIEEAIAKNTPIGSLVFFDRGHKFYAIRFAASPTLAFDMTTRLWCEFTTGLGDVPWLMTHRTLINKVQYFGSNDGIYTQSDATFKDGQDLIDAEAISMPIVNAGKHITIKEIWLKVLTGQVDIGREPEISLQLSTDGRNWGDEKWRGLGRLGNYGKQLWWKGLGRYRRVQARFRTNDPVNRDITGMGYE